MNDTKTSEHTPKFPNEADDEPAVIRDSTNTHNPRPGCSKLG